MEADSTSRDGWIRHLEGLARTRPTHADVWCTLGQALYAVGQLDAARQAFDRALRLNPSYVDAALARCDVLGALGDAREGFAQLRPMFGLAPDSFQMVFAVGVYSMRHGFAETGLSQLRRAARLQPRAPYVVRFLATALEQLGDAVGARQELERAQQLEAALPTPLGVDAAMHWRRTWPSPGLARLHVERARFLFDAGREDDAMAELTIAISRFPGHAQVMVETGRSQLLRDRGDVAERWFTGAIAVDPSCHEAQLELAFLLASDGRLPAAVDGMRRVVELRPMYPDYRYGYGTLLLDLGRIDEAATQFEQALILRPDDGRSALQLAATYHKSGRIDEARDLLHAGPWRTWPEARTLLAEILVGEARWDEAREVLEQVLVQLPDHEHAREILAAIRG